MRAKGEVSAAGPAWCGRPESNRHRPCGPTDFLTRHGFRRPADAGLGSGLSLRPSAHRALGAARLVSTPSRLTAGLARDRHFFRGFPDFERFYSGGFPLEHSNCFKSVASTSFATPACTRRVSYRARPARPTSLDFSVGFSRAGPASCGSAPERTGQCPRENRSRCPARLR